jgi:hypothetical protein
MAQYQLTTPPVSLPTATGPGVVTMPSRGSGGVVRFDLAALAQMALANRRR